MAGFVHQTGGNLGKQSVALIFTVLEIVAPVGLLALAGFLWVRRGQEFPQAFVSKIIMNLSVPALLFTALMKTELDPTSLTTVTLAAFLGYAGLTVIFWALTKGLGLERRIYHAPLIFGNTGNVGLPLALFAFGQAGLGYAVVVFAVMIIWNFTIGIWLITGGTSPWRALKEPSMMGTLLGALFLSQGWQTPLWLTHSLDLLGQIAIPLMLLMLGVAIARMTADNLGRALWVSVLRALVTTAVAAGIGLSLGLEPVALAVLILQLGSPVAVTSYMFAQKYDAGPDEVAGLVMVSTLLSVVTLPVTLAFLI